MTKNEVKNEIRERLQLLALGTVKVHIVNEVIIIDILSVVAPLYRNIFYNLDELINDYLSIDSFVDQVYVEYCKYIRKILGF